MNTSRRNKLVEFLEYRGELDEFSDPALTTVGRCYAEVISKAPKEAISTGQMAEVEYLQVTFLESDAKRLKVNGKMKLKADGGIFEINTPPYNPFSTEKGYVRLDVSRKLQS